jgi:hypothetical protein
MQGCIIVDRRMLSSGHAFHFVSGGRLAGDGGASLANRPEAA